MVPPPNQYLTESQGADRILSLGVKACLRGSDLPSLTCNVVPVSSMEKYNNIAKKHQLKRSGDDTYFSPFIELTRQYAKYLLYCTKCVTNIGMVRYTLLEYKMTTTQGTVGMTEVLLGQKVTSLDCADYIKDMVKALIEEKKLAEKGQKYSMEMLVHFMRGLQNEFDNLVGDEEDEECWFRP